jgi:hypothetical protein
MPPVRLRAHAALALALALMLVLVAALAGCGSGSSQADGTEASPATVVPAGVPLYLEATVRPTGTMASGALAAGADLTGESDPYRRLLGELRTPGSPELQSSDVSSWLGPHAGVFVSSLGSAEALLTLVGQLLSGKQSVAALPFGSGHLEGAMVLDTSNASAARSFLAQQAGHAHARPGSYRGVSYELTAQDLAFGLVGRFAVIGSEDALRDVIGASQGEPALAGAGGYSKLAGHAPAGAIGHLYVNPEASSAGASKRASSLLALLGSHQQANASVTLTGSSLSLDLDTLAGEGATSGLLTPDPSAARALSELPGESWLAVGLGPLGEHLSSDVDGLSALSSLLGGAGAEATPGTLSLGSLVEGLFKPLQILGANTPQAHRDFGSWMGPAGIFAAGASVLELKAGVVISSSDAAASRAAVATLGRMLRASGSEVTPLTIAGTEAAIAARVNGLPLALDIADGRSSNGSAKFVLALGEAAIADALSPQSTMASSASRAAAASTLGEGQQPSVMLDVPTLLSLLEGIGLTDEPSLASALGVLRASGTVAGGGRDLGEGVERFRLVLGLHAPSG